MSENTLNKTFLIPKAIEYIKRNNYNMDIFMPSPQIYDGSMNFMVLFGELDFTNETTNIDNHLYFNLPKKGLEEIYLELIGFLCKLFMIEININNAFIVQNIENFVNNQNNLLNEISDLFSEFTNIKDIESVMKTDKVKFAIIINNQGEDCKKDVPIPTKLEDFVTSHNFSKIIVGKKSPNAIFINKINGFLMRVNEKK